jgi:pyridoxine kinase
MDGLIQNNLDDYTHLLTGYVGSASFLKEIAKVIQNLKKKNPNMVYGKLHFIFLQKMCGYT